MRNSNKYSNKHKTEKVNISKPLSILIKLFHYMGISTFNEMEMTNRYQKICHLKWCYLYLATIPFLYFVIFYYHRKLFFTADNFGHVSDFIKIFVVGISHLVTIIETICTQKSSEKFFRIYAALHAQWTNAKRTKNEFKIYKKFFLLMILNAVAVFGVEIYYAFEIRHKKKWILFFVTYMPSVTICRFRILQISMNLYLIMIELQQLNNELLELGKSTRTIKLNVIEDIIYQDLSVLMRKYQQIHLMMELLNKTHSISFLFIFVKSYVKILSDSYWAYWVIYNQDDVHEFAECSLVIPTAINIFLPMIISKDCMDVANLIPQSLHSIRHRVENLRLSCKIQNFSLQLKHQQIIFDAFGCFRVDCYIVNGILSSITTYMIFYIEFMPKFKNF